MESALFETLPFGLFEQLAAAPFGEFWLALGFFALTASIYATGVPGTLVPISFSSGLLLGPAGMVVVGAGAMLGALVMYIALERCSHATLRRKYARHLSRLDRLKSAGGIVPLIGLRLIGLPHVIVTGLCALAAVGPRRYALATAVGVVPAIALSSIAGATI